MDDVVNLGFDLSQILGKTEEVATDMLKAVGRPFRVIERDGSPMGLTADFKSNRVGLIVNKGLVDSYRLG